MNNLMTLAPEIFLLGAICFILLADLWIAPHRRGLTHAFSIISLIIGIVLTIRPHAEVQTAFSGLFIRDGLADLLKVGILSVTTLVFIYAKPYLRANNLFQSEFYVLCLSGVLGMMLLVSANHLIMIYMGLELLALSSYALVALNRDSPLSSEAAMKYFVLGALASGLLLYGISMIYGATGSLDLSAIHGYASTSYDSTLLAFGLTFLVIGVAFKLGAVPFHMWLPDVYEGSPSAVTLFIASAPKIAAFGMIYRLFEGALSSLHAYWQPMFAILAILSLVIGNLVAISQTNLKRMLAYSTISHVGFLLMGLVGASTASYAAALFYVLTYAITATAAFGMIILLSRSGFEADEIKDFKGLNQRNNWYALMMLMIMASLAGVPIWVGFVAKFAVLKAALDAGFLGLVLAAAVFAVIGAFYYLRVIKVMYFDEPKNLDPLPMPNDILFRFALSLNGVLLLALGLMSDPLMRWCMRAVS